jgi:hypothetical protein
VKSGSILGVLKIYSLLAYNKFFGEEIGQYLPSPDQSRRYCFSLSSVNSCGNGSRQQDSRGKNRYGSFLGRNKYSIACLSTERLTIRDRLRHNCYLSSRMGLPVLVKSDLAHFSTVTSRIYTLTGASQPRNE